MLTLKIPERDYFDDRTQTFIHVNGYTLQLEHSLISISKWESKWKKAFISNDQRTVDESRDYIKCMTLNSVPDSAYNYLTQEDYDKVSNYIDDTMTATKFSDKSQKKGIIKKKIVTSEEIYYWMVSFGIPFECQKWHLNRLLTLIHICEAKNSPGKKMSKRDTLSQYAALNASRKKKMGTRG